MKMTSMREELQKFVGQRLLIDLIGKDFAPKGILKKVDDDFIIINETRVSINAIAGFKISRGEGG